MCRGPSAWGPPFLSRDFPTVVGSVGLKQIKSSWCLSVLYVWLSPCKLEALCKYGGIKKHMEMPPEAAHRSKEKHGPQFLPELHLSSSTCRKESKWEMAAQLMSEISSLDSKHLEHVGVFLFGPDCPKFFNRSSPLPNPSKSFGHKIAWWLQGAPESRPQWWHSSLAELGSSSQDGFWFHDFSWMCMWWIETPGGVVGCPCWKAPERPFLCLKVEPLLLTVLTTFSRGGTPCFWRWPTERNGQGPCMWLLKWWRMRPATTRWILAVMQSPKILLANWPVAKSMGCHQGSMHWRVVDNGKRHCASCKWCLRRHSSRQTWAPKTDQ